MSPPTGPNQPDAPAAAGAASTSTAPSAAGALTKEKKKKHHLNSATDPLLAELRDLNFSAVGKKLNQVARRLDEDYKVGARYHPGRLATARSALEARAAVAGQWRVLTVGALYSSGIRRRRSPSCATSWASLEGCRATTSR